MKLRRLLETSFVCLWMASLAAAEIAFVSELDEGEGGRLFVTCSTSDETVELVQEGDTAAFRRSNGGGVKCNVVVAVSRCAQSLQADLDPSSGLVDAKDSFTWTVSRRGISLDDQDVAYWWAPECFEPSSSSLLRSTESLDGTTRWNF